MEQLLAAIPVKEGTEDIAIACLRAELSILELGQELDCQLSAGRELL